MKQGSIEVRRDWLSKSLAGMLLGFGLGLGVSGLFMLLVKGIAPNIHVQLAMWLLVPVWMLVMSTVFLFRSGLSAWVWLGSANFLLFALFYLIQSF